MRVRPLSQLLPPTPPPLALGIVAALGLIAAETLVVYPLRRVAPGVYLTLVFLPGVLVVSTVWGLALGAATALVSAAAFDVFHVPSGGGFAPTTRDLAALTVFLAVALMLGSVADLARSRAVEADERRGDADLAADIGRRLLRTGDLRSALPGASRRLAEALGLADASIELEEVAGDDRRAAFPLRDRGIRLGTLVVPRDLPRRTRQRLRERVVPSVEELLRAAREREAVGAALAESRDELRALADEQAALRRVATLVARAVPPPDVFGAIAAEVGELLGADATRLLRYEADGASAIDVGGRSDLGADLPGGPGGRLTLEGENIPASVLRTGGPARMDTFEDVPGSIAAALRELGVGCSVGAPVVVEGRVWGVLIAVWRDHEPPDDAEARLAQFTELIATAVANANSRAELAASRARVITTADETRRRLERDLHDGAQQRLVHAVITLKLARQALGDEAGPGVELVHDALEQAEEAMAELRELAHGILPSALRHGLLAGIESLVSRVRLPVSIDVTAERLPPALEATAYFMVAEALTNVIKHASASSACVTARIDAGALHIEVQDDGVGGARLERSSGLLGLQDRAAALGGELRVASPPGGGTVLAATLPIPGS
jgi:signal transduction histidine kinase